MLCSSEHNQVLHSALYATLRVTQQPGLGAWTRTIDDSFTYPGLRSPAL